MKNKLTNKLCILCEMVIFYLVMISLVFVGHMLLGSSVGRTSISYNFMSRTMAIMGVFSCSCLLFLTNFLFTKLKYRIRLVLCLLSGILLIEGYTICIGILHRQQPFAFIGANQMLFLEFFLLLLGWFIYAKFTSHRYNKLLSDFQHQNQN